MDKSVLLLAAGEQARWPITAEPKQLLYAGKETIIDRIIRQCNERGHVPTVITHKSILIRPHAHMYCPTNRRWKVESLLDVKRVWGEKRTLVLLADVIFQGQVMNRIFEYDGEDMFFGNYAEIFAYTFTNNRIAARMMKTTLRRCELRGDIGSLHSLFRAYINEFDTKRLEYAKDKSKVFTHVTGDGGWTRDIDSPEEYSLFMDQVVLRNKLDDLPKEK